MVVVCGGDGTFQFSAFSQDLLDTNVLLWYHCDTGCLANIYFTMFQEGKMADTAQFSNLIHPALNHPYDGLDQWHLSFDVEGHLAEYQCFSAGGCSHP
jgi:hypothetical protein